jgi:hypothetical protein
VSLSSLQLSRRVGQHRVVDDRVRPCCLFARTDASEEPLAGNTPDFRIDLGLVPFHVLGQRDELGHFAGHAAAGS